MVWPKTDFSELVGIEHPIIQAPMAGSSTPELAAAVSNAGGLGSMGFAEASPGDVRARVGMLRAATGRPFNLNFFAHKAPRQDVRIDAELEDRLRPVYRELGLGEVPLFTRAPFGHFSSDALDVLLELRPPVVSFHFGLPDAKTVGALKHRGCILMCSATTVAEAGKLRDAGVDVIIAQGWEAGGHRGSFEPGLEDFGIGTVALVPQIVDAVDVPVIAAGGIADGRGIAAAFALGASGVQMGTAFLSCPEANVSETHRAALRAAGDEDTRLTRAFSGRPARARMNRYTEAMAGQRTLPDFPTMYSLSEPLRKYGVDRDDPEFQFLLYGQAAALNRELPAAELVRTLIEEAQELLYGRIG